MNVVERAEVIVTSPSRNYVVLKLTTSDGVVGWGDATLNGRELAVASYLEDHLLPLLVGRDADRIEDTWQLFHRGAYWRRGPVTMAAIGAIDLALWDVKGKSLGVPVHQLLGGPVRDGILAYTHARGWDVPELLDAVDRRREEGFRAVRAQSGVPGLASVYGVGADPARNPADEPAARGELLTEVWDTPSYLRHVPGVLHAVREHVGPDLHLLHDAHHRLTPTQAVRLGRALEDVDLFWLEDVTPVENQQVLRQVRAGTTVPLAIGEVFNHVVDGHELVAERLIDYLRIAISHGGGISAVRKALAHADVYGVKGAPHGPSDISPVALSASLHVGLSTHNVAIQEFMGYDPQVSDVFATTWRFADGYLHPGDHPGLGVEVDELAAARHPYQRAYLPVARTLDGAVSDW